MHCLVTMTKEDKISPFERVMAWLPEAFKPWASSSGFLSLTLNEVLNERDTRISGLPNASRLKTALISVLQKLKSRRENSDSAAVVIAPSREVEELAFHMATQLSSDNTLRIAASTGIRDTAGLTQLFANGIDLLITNPKILEKIFDKGFASPEQFKTVLIDGAEWHDVLDETARIESLCERFPAARQLIVTGPVGAENADDPYTALLHAPAFCRAADDQARATPPAERVILIPEEEWENCLKTEGERTPILYPVTTATDATRLVSLLKESDITAKRAASTQSDSARETLLLKFAAGRIEHLVMPHALMPELGEQKIARLVQTSFDGGPQAYLEYLALVADESGELITIVTPETLPLFEKLLCAAEKRLTLENPYGLKEPRSVIGQLIRREKLTIRTNFTRDTQPTEVEATAPETEERQESDEDNRFNRRYDRKRPFDKKFNRYKKSNRRVVKDGDTPKSDDEGNEMPKKKHFKERRFTKKRPYRGRQREEATETTSSEVAETAPNVTTEVTPTPVDTNEVPATVTTPTTAETKEPNTDKPYRRKPRKFVPRKKAKATSDAPATNEGASDEQPKAFENKPYDKKRYQKKRPNPKARREKQWDDDNFGNSIHYQPKRQNHRDLRNDQPLYWEPTDPYHPSSQALSLPQMMPDEFRRAPKGNFNRNRPNNFRRKRDGER